jgi:hypothetical protein
MGVTAGLRPVLRLPCAAFIFVSRPLSATTRPSSPSFALFVIVFGALHYFPQLRHAT